MKKNTIYPISDLCKKFFKQKQDWKIILISKWPDIIGNLSKHVTLEKIKGDTAILGVLDSCWMQELYMMQVELMRMINKNFKTDHIKKIVFKITQQKKYSLKKTTAEVYKNEQQKEISASQKESLLIIKDEELRSAIHTFFKKCNYVVRKQNEANKISHRHRNSIKP